MNCIYASKQIQQIWPDFTAHFKSETTAASYLADVTEIMNYFEKDFLKIRKKEVQQYFERMEQKWKSGQIQPATVAKKFRELHSFADYICENRERYQISEGFRDEYESYLKLTAKQEKYTKSVPVEHIDALLKAAEDDLPAYLILVFLHRMGLSSTEIIALQRADFAEYDNGIFVDVKDRREQCFVPEDVAEVLKIYLAESEENEYLLYNSRGNQLNLMYISRMMKKYTTLAEIPAYSAENIRNTCGVTMFAYGASPDQVARQMGVTQTQIHRYRNMTYREHLQQSAHNLVKIRIEPPK